MDKYYIVSNKDSGTVCKELKEILDVPKNIWINCNPFMEKISLTMPLYDKYIYRYVYIKDSKVDLAKLRKKVEELKEIYEKEKEKIEEVKYYLKKLAQVMHGIFPYGVKPSIKVNAVDNGDGYVIEMVYHIRHEEADSFIELMENIER